MTCLSDRSVGMHMVNPGSECRIGDMDSAVCLGWGGMHVETKTASGFIGRKPSSLDL